MPITPAYWGDGSLYGDGDYYFAPSQAPAEYIVEYETHCHRLSVRISYTADTSPGLTEAFRLYDIRARLAPDRQASFTYEAFVDRTTPSERVSAVIHHAGSELIISHIQLIAQRKKHQRKG